MEEKMVTEFTLEDGSVFQVLTQEEIDGHLYLYLVNVNDGEDVMIQEYKDEELLGVPEEKTLELIQVFQNKYKKSS
ncbi:MAG: hypothetical protein IJ772_06040 [Bacilli bacterium]|nr:hypothetical protein [Bacilli bacterium]MBR1818395.1 hypothetical protein [Bacilli bacterium]